GASVCQGPFLGYAFDMRAITLAPRASVCRSTFDNAFLHASADELDLEMRGTHVWDFGRLSLGVGIAVGVAWMREEFRSEGQTPTRNAVAAHLGVIGAVTVDMLQGFYSGVEFDAMTYFFNQQISMGNVIETPFAFRISLLVLGKRW